MFGAHKTGPAVNVVIGNVEPQLLNDLICAICSRRLNPDLARTGCDCRDPANFHARSIARAVKFACFPTKADGIVEIEVPLPRFAICASPVMQVLLPIH